MTLEELHLIRDMIKLLSENTMLRDHALWIIQREIKLKTMNPSKEP